MTNLKGVFFITEGGGLGQQANLQGEAFDVPWEDTALESLFPALVVDNKDKCQLWSAAEYKPGAKRGKDGIVCLHAVVLDADYCDVGAAGKVSEHLMSRRQAAFLYTGFSHMNPNKVHEDTALKGPFDSFRIVLPVSRPILPSEYASVVAAVFSTHIVPPDPPHYANEILGKKILVNPTLKKYRAASARGWDKASYRYSQGWFVPACPQNRQKHAAFEVYHGDVLDVDALVALRVHPPTSEALPAEAREHGEATAGAIACFDVFVKAMEAAGIPCRGASPRAQNRSMCPCCQKQPDSFSFTVLGDHVALNCFRKCPFGDILEALGIESDSLQDPAVSEETRDFMQHVTLALGEPKPRGDLPVNEQEAAIRRAFGTDRSTPYTPEEIASMEPIQKRWVLATPAGNFIREPGGDYIGPFQDKHVPVKARDVLAPAYTADVFLTKTNEKTQERTPKTLSEILDQYGQVPSRMAYSYIVPRSVLVENTFTQRAARLKPFAPVFHPHIDEWLKLFGNKGYEPLLDWLATLFTLNRPTAAVCIMGQSGSGKGMFAEGLSQLWGGRIAFDRALDHFNGALIDSPLVFADEEVKAPFGFKGSVAEALKDMISSDTRKVEAKYANAVDLHGCLRVVMATNAEGVIKFDRQPTEADIQALDDRILLVRPSLDTKPYLISIGGRDTTEAWVRGGLIAEHVTWLSRNRKVTPGHRFLVQGQGGMSTILATDGRGSSAVLAALLKALLGPMKTDGKVCHLGSDGKVWASMAKLLANWPALGDTAAPPEDLKTAFDIICEPNTSHSKTVDHESIRFRQVKDLVLLRAVNSEGEERLETYFQLRPLEKEKQD